MARRALWFPLPWGEGTRSPDLRGEDPRPATAPVDPLDAAGCEGLFLFLVVGAYAAALFLLVIPFFNGSLGALLHHRVGSGSVFWDRYAWLGATPLLALRNVFLEPGRLLAWFTQRDVLAYLATLALSGGGIALAAPEALAVALPIVLQDSLSSFAWMRSGGAHYSANLVPLLVFAGIEGTRRLSRHCWAQRSLARLAVVWRQNEFPFPHPFRERATSLLSTDLKVSDSLSPRERESESLTLTLSLGERESESRSPGERGSDFRALPSSPWPWSWRWRTTSGSEHRRWCRATCGRRRT